MSQNTFQQTTPHPPLSLGQAQAFDQDRCVVLVEWVDGARVAIVAVSGHKVRWCIQLQQQLIDDDELECRQWVAALVGAVVVVVEVVGMAAGHVDIAAAAAVVAAVAAVAAAVANYYCDYYAAVVVLD
jgi:hypothetical protein